MDKEKRKEIARKVKMEKVFWFGSDGVSMGHTEVYEFPRQRGDKKS
jgi:hypothetical protein